MAKGEKKSIQSCGGIEQYLEATRNPVWKKYHNDRTCYDAYLEIKKNLKPIQETVVSGAMFESIQTALGEYKGKIDAICSEYEGEACKKKIQELFSSNPVIFLNDHGPGHMEKVIERANDIVSHFKTDPPSEFEAFLLLSAIQIHDIGNILGRAAHEKKLVEILRSNIIHILTSHFLILS